MTRDEMKRRTAAFALMVIRFVEQLPKTRTADVLGRQLLRCGTSVGSNYRAACRARSRAEFLSKLGIVEEEADETLYWLEMLVQSGSATQEVAAPLLDEADQILAIIVATIVSTRQNAG